MFECLKAFLISRIWFELINLHACITTAMTLHIFSAAAADLSLQWEVRLYERSLNEKLQSDYCCQKN